ncbi:MAG: UDP-2,3-diacylglucosamine diphosphatase LpxI [Alphaproteobacteria bacterium]|nr:UDP-2,3-diacylglucosamine diphosphatase LpxI [Alphaproteobacteria bacterium]MBV9694915.1 UDP-2,3-diacylglucosamine diphosphatase LpxI [Alphaproteobacteria bacterium]
MGALGVIAGGGALPRSIAESARTAGREVFVLGLGGYAEGWIAGFPHETVALGELGKAVKALRAHHCDDVTLAGKVSRPRFAEIRLDAKAVLAAPRVIAAALKGDDALLRAVIDMFEREGLRVIGTAEAAPDLIAKAGTMGRIAPSTQARSDIAAALEIVRAMGTFDVGQAAIVCDGLPLAVEAAEGTDAMIARVASLPEQIRGTRDKPRGVLVKAPKPTQDRRTDLPVVGIETVRNAHAVFLTGLAVEAGGALIVDREAVVAEADRLGLFLQGIAN